MREVLSAAITEMLLKRSSVEEKPKIPEEIQMDVDDYLELHEMYTQLEAQLKKLRKNIEPFMEVNDITRIEGSNGKAIEIVDQVRANVTSNFTTYDVDAVRDMVPKRYLNQVIVECVDRDKLEALVKLGRVKQTVYRHKTFKSTPCFMVRKL